MRFYRSIAALASLLVPLAAHAQSIQKYFGYFAADVNDPSEYQDHTNLVQIDIWSGDQSPSGRATSKQYLLDALAKAKASHLHAVIPGWPFLFQGTGNPCFSSDPNGYQAWNDLAQDLVTKGYLDQAHPDRSVVTAVYVVDEPNNHCMSDSNGSPNPALSLAINNIRANPNTNLLPLASILAVQGSKFSEIKKGIQLFDWIGFDHYGISTSQWQSELGTLKGYAMNKKLIIVPGAQSATITNQCVGTDNPTPFIQQMQTDPQVAWLAPFVWFDSSPQCLGVRSNPGLKTTYVNFGRVVKAQGCSSSGAARNFCKPASIAPIINMLLDQ